MLYPKMKWDSVNGVGYLYLRPGKIHKTACLTVDTYADLDVKGNILGIELMAIYPENVERFKKLIPVEEYKKTD